MIHHQIDVALGERSYPIYVGSGMTASLAPTCRQHGIPDRVVVLTDRNVAPLYLAPLLKNLRHFKFDVTSFILPPGERQKSLQRANTVFTWMLEAGVGRKSAVIALGGGVIGDLAGFIAATYQRGVPLIQVPTTLLAQVDSSIGGKVAVNHPLGKNMIGAFHQPKFVWSDMVCLRTLPAREIVSGLGEVIKYGVILDAGLFDDLETNIDRVLSLEVDAVLRVQTRCAELKADLTSRDEKESGMRIVLNYGHTVGHALEAAGNYRVLNHGEAVLLGMIAESSIALALGMIGQDVHDRIVGLIRRVPLKFRAKRLDLTKVIELMSHDKKSIGGKKRFVLPTRVGDVQVTEGVERSLIRSSLLSTFKLYTSKSR
ncbi:MAG: 3-dehydroquinate synthase [Bacteroidota bacterium]